MDSQPLYDLAPLAQMMLLGIVIALLVRISDESATVSRRSMPGLGQG